MTVQTTSFQLALILFIPTCSFQFITAINPEKTWFLKGFRRASKMLKSERGQIFPNLKDKSREINLTSENCAISLIIWKISRAVPLTDSSLIISPILARNWKILLFYKLLQFHVGDYELRQNQKNFLKDAMWNFCRPHIKFELTPPNLLILHNKQQNIGISMNLFQIKWPQCKLVSTITRDGFEGTFWTDYFKLTLISSLDIW